MEITDYKIKTIKYPHGEYLFSNPVKAIDEGSFYRIDGTYIFDKHKIQSVNLEEDRLVLVMTDKTVILEVEHDNQC